MLKLHTPLRTIAAFFLLLHLKPLYLSWELDKHVLRFINSQMHLRIFRLFMQMIFITSFVFLKVKDYFPACEENCLKQGALKYLLVMVIVRKTDYYNK